MPQSDAHGWRNGALLASIALAAALALAAAWISALARVPQQRAAVERLLRAQTGLDVSYGRLVVRLGFYGPEAEFGNVEMRRPGSGTAAPLLRAPRMVARFESWRLLRGGQLRPGRVLVTGAELDLRQLSDLRREGRGVRGAAGAGAAAGTSPGGVAGQAAAGGSRPGATAAFPAASDVDAGPLAALESRLPSLLAGVPEGSLEFEAVTLVWRDPRRPTAALQVRAPRLYASRRGDAAQLSGTLLLPGRFGRTLFVAAQLRDPGGGFEGRLRATGRGLVLASWRELGLLPESLVGGSGDVALAVQLRDGRVQKVEGDLRLAGLGFVAPGPVVARRFGLAAADFDFARLPGAGLRWRLREVQLQPVGVAATPFAERGALELVRRDAGRSGELTARRLPIEALALLVAALGRDAPAPPMPALRITAGEVADLESRWSAAAHGTATRASLEGMVLGSADGRWRADGVDAQLEGDGMHWRLRLDGRDALLRLPGLEPASQPLRAVLGGTLELAAATRGWSLALPDFAVRFADGPALQVRGSAGGDAAGVGASRFEVVLAEPLPRAAMALPQALLGERLPAGFWAAFTAGRLESARLEFVDARPGSAALALREVDFAGEGARPAASGLTLELGWDGRRLAGSLSGGQVGTLRLEAGRLAWTGGAAGGGGAAGAGGSDLEVEARLAGSVEEALRMLPSGALAPDAAAGLGGRARVEARLRGGARPQRAGPRAREPTLDYTIDVEEGRWQPLEAAAPFGALRGRLRADARGLRDGRLEGRWLGGPVQLRLETDAARAAPRILATGRLARAALEREWSWLGLVEHGGRDTLDWSAELRREPEETAGPAGRRALQARAAADRAPGSWRMRVALAAAARAELNWVPDAERPGWRLDRGVLRVGDDDALAGIPGALVVGGRLGRLDLAGLAGALSRLAGGDGWQRPLVGEVTVEDVALGGSSLGEVRLRLAGSRESTAVDLQGEAIAGELLQVHAEAARLQARLARLRLPPQAPLADLADAFLPARTTFVLQVADLRRGQRSLGELAATFEADGAAIATRDLALRRGARRLGASGRCERATRTCTAEFALADADLADLLRDLGHEPRLRGDEVAALGRIGWSMQPDARFAATLQGEVELRARLYGRVPVAAGDPPDPAASAAAADAAAIAPAPLASQASSPAGDEPGESSPATWPLLSPLLATVAAQRAALLAEAAAAPAEAPPAARAPGVAPPRAVPADPATLEGALEMQRLDLRLAIRDGVATIERYEAVGRDARLSIAGRFDFRRGELEQQAEWYWIAPGVAGAVDRLDPRSPLAAGLRTLRDLFGARGGERAASRGELEAGVPGGAARRFELAGPLQRPRVEPAALLDSPR